MEQKQIEIIGFSWADGTRDCGRHGERNKCISCHSTQCPIPVHCERYKAILNKRALDWDAANPAV